MVARLLRWIDLYTREQVASTGNAAWTEGWRFAVSFLWYSLEDYDREELMSRCDE